MACGPKTLFGRTTVRFPGQSGQPPVATGISIPGPADAGGFLAATVVGGQVVAATSASNRFIDTAAQRVVFGTPSRDGLPLSAVAISPDSAIHSCLVSLSGNSSESESFRCSPGNPVVLPAGTDHAWVSQISGIPVTNSFDDGLAWDAVDGGNTFQTTTTERAWGYPLRLLCIYGDIPQMSPIRSPYYGRIRINTGLRDTAESAVWFCVDGRKRWAMTLQVNGTNAGTTGIDFTPSYVRNKTNDTFPNEDNLQIVPISATRTVLSSGAVAMVSSEDFISSVSSYVIPASFPLIKLSLASVDVTGAQGLDISLAAFD